MTRIAEKQHTYLSRLLSCEGTSTRFSPLGDPLGQDLVPVGESIKYNRSICISVKVSGNEDEDEGRK